MNIAPDTNRLLDLCICKAHAGFHHLGLMKVRVECTECAECTEEYDERWQAAIKWNQDMRKKHDKTNRKSSGPKTTTHTSSV